MEFFFLFKAVAIAIFTFIAMQFFFLLKLLCSGIIGWYVWGWAQEMLETTKGILEELKKNGPSNKKILND